MGINLFKVSKTLWAVQYQLKGSTKVETNKFISVEAACDFLESLGIYDSEIDMALSFLSGHEHTRANFGINGSFIYTDNQHMFEMAGVA